MFEYVCAFVRACVHACEPSCVYCCACRPHSEDSSMVIHSTVNHSTSPVTVGEALDSEWRMRARGGEIRGEMECLVLCTHICPHSMADRVYKTKHTPTLCSIWSVPVFGKGCVCGGWEMRGGVGMCVFLCVCVWEGTVSKCACVRGVWGGGGMHVCACMSVCAWACHR